MTVRIQLKDGAISVGGNFQSAKDAAKSLPGARWNPAAKRWEATTLTVAEASKRLAGRPLDVDGPRGGSHITRYGNGYSENEWAAMGAARKAEDEVFQAFAARRKALGDEAMRRLDAMGVPATHRVALTNRWYEFDDQVARGALQFSSPQREREIRAFVAWYGGEAAKLREEEDAAREAATALVWERYGIE